MNTIEAHTQSSTTQSASNNTSNKMSNQINNGKITCHLVSLPKVVLTRIDEGKLGAKIIASSSIKTPFKRLEGKKGKISPVKTKVNVTKSPATPLNVKSRIRHKKDLSFPLQSPKPTKKIVAGKLLTPIQNLPFKSPKSQKKITTPKMHVQEHKSNKSKKKIVAAKLESQGKKTQKKSSIGVDERQLVRPIKNMLKKTMLQKKSKIVIPAPNKSKLSPVKNKQAVSKQKALGSTKTKKKVSPKIPIGIPLNKPENTDLSEEEFLYDELIDDIEHPTMDQFEAERPVAEKTTNITLKPNVGNKLPTVVKGGIIKKTILPPDLKPIASLNDDIKYNGPHSTTSVEDKRKSTISRKRTKSPDEFASPSPSKKPSPWPVSISSSPKMSIESPKVKGNKRPTPSSKTTARGKSTNTPKVPQKPKAIMSSPISFPNSNGLDMKTSAIIKPKIGPKQTAKVVPISKFQVQEDNLSDEYTEEETLENIDSDSGDLFLKPRDEPTSNEGVLKDNPQISRTQLNNKPQTYDTSRDDEDPHLDLLRILTDDSDEPGQYQPLESSGKELQSDINNLSNDPVIESEMENDTSCVDSLGVEPDSESVVEEPPTRTIYDVMNEISLQYPSWNLHILPETSAFCIAQVTKGRLGLPTLKKCIELDPNDYNAKVYIHQYHIKRFNGVYDSEESIIALIEEINSIKA